MQRLSTGMLPDPDLSGVRELTPLGKQIEVLRIGRGMSKQHLARFAGTSRQQLWRVMTGKSELTEGMRQRLALALRIDGGSLVSHDASPTKAQTSSRSIGVSLETYISTPELAERTLRTLPNGDVGRELKRMILTAIEDVAIERRLELPAQFFELRRRVLVNEI